MSIFRRNSCLTPEIQSKYSRIGECVGIGQTTVLNWIRVAQGPTALAVGAGGVV